LPAIGFASLLCEISFSGILFSGVGAKLKLNPEIYA
jgi:hypothetical protein